ncbi:MAG TPA: lytic murein transglycosylase, partial [Nocardioidaceae bacterium]|nr:lytic murein transglycosylase [Nocardioidaceae bacterium]
MAICLLVLGNESGPQAAPTGKKYYDGELTIAAPATRPATPAGPAAVTMATPKGQVTAAQPMELGRFDIPVTALLAYQRAADILAEVKPSCALRWTLLAAIGRVESDHGRYGASNLGADGVSRPEVVGVPLDGQGQVATIADTDGGQWDGDPRWDHAVGPMQFIPATWEVVGVDGDGDGKRSINDIDDAALAAGIYLCAGSENLNVPGAVDAALHRYNDSDSYAALVLAYERKYEGGDFVVTAPGGALAAASATLSLHPLAGTPLKANSPAEARTQAKIKADAKHAVAAADKNGGRTPGISSATAPGKVVAAALTTPSETRGAQA